MGLFGPTFVPCTSGVWTTLIWNFGTGFPQTYVVTLALPPAGGDYRTSFREAANIQGDFEEKRALWIFPLAATQGRLEPRMTFSRDWINAYYTVRIRPEVTCIAKVH